MNDNELQARLTEFIRLLERRKLQDLEEAIRQTKDDIARPDRKTYNPNEIDWSAR